MHLIANGSVAKFTPKYQGVPPSCSHHCCQQIKYYTFHCRNTVVCTWCIGSSCTSCRDLRNICSSTCQLDSWISFAGYRKPCFVFSTCWPLQAKPVKKSKTPNREIPSSGHLLSLSRKCHGGVVGIVGIITGAAGTQGRRGEGWKCQAPPTLWHCKSRTETGAGPSYVWPESGKRICKWNRKSGQIRLCVPIRESCLRAE